MLNKFYKKMSNSSINNSKISKILDKECKKCNEILELEDWIENLYVCPHCGFHYRIGPMERLNMVLDAGSFVEWDKNLEYDDPIKFPEYKEKIKHIKSVTNLDEAVITGAGEICGKEVAIGVMASNFLMGSMGKVVGEKITRLIETATSKRLPLIIFCCSGGARMQEGVVSLMQMAKTSAALKKHDEASLLYISILTDPTTGGVTASFAMLADIILAEPGSLIGFAGPRVIEQTIGKKLPEGFQLSEFILEHGFVDKIVKRKKMKEILDRLINS